MDEPVKKYVHLPYRVNLERQRHIQAGLIPVAIQAAGQTHRLSNGIEIDNRRRPDFSARRRWKHPSELQARTLRPAKSLAGMAHTAGYKYGG